MTIPAVTAPETEFADVVAPVALALDQERRVSDQIAALTEVARDEGDYLSEQFVQWFLKEQVEEVATMSSLLAVVQRSGDNPMQIEDYLVARALKRRGRRSNCAAGGGRRALVTCTEPSGRAGAARRARRRGGSSPCSQSRCSSSAWANLRECYRARRAAARA